MILPYVYSTANIFIEWNFSYLENESDHKISELFKVDRYESQSFSNTFTLLYFKNVFVCF